MRTVLFSTLYPSQARPGHGLFVEARLRHLVKSGQVESRVVAPVPWFPSTDERFGEYAQFAATPGFETRYDLDVFHPRYFLPPKIGMSVAPILLALGARRQMTRLVESGFDFDLIDAHYYYPDGVAATILGRWLRKPVVVTSRGSDINVLSDYAMPRRWIRRARDSAAASIFVSKALKDRMAEISGSDEGLHVVRNGVDLEEFPLRDRGQCQSALGLVDGRWMIYVGRLTRPKGVHLVIRTLAELSEDVKLAFVGDGVEAESLRQLAVETGTAHRIRFAGARPQQELSSWYSAASVLVLPSENEGIPNVILESLACGTPVVASVVGGIPEVMTTEVSGRMVETPDVPSFAAAVRDVLDANHDRNAVREHAGSFSWQETTRSQIELFRKVIEAQERPIRA